MLLILLALLALCMILLVHGHKTQRLLEKRLRSANQSLEFLQHSFSRFAPAAIVDQILAQGASAQPEKREVTVLFADLRGFTSLSETLDPAVLVTILNGYFQEMSRAIIDNNGHVAKFMGDGIMAIFGAIERNPWQCNDAAHAALAMCEALEGYNEKLVAEGLPELSLGIGIHRGVVVAGVIGSQDLMEYTVIGDHVNLAARVETLTREHGVEILITEAVRSQLDARFALREFAGRQVKGVSEPVKTFALESFQTESALVS